MELNSQINTFSKGMNMDIDVTMMPEGYYRYAENIRLITNAGGTTGVVLNTDHIKKYGGSIPNNEEILGTATALLYDPDTEGTVECGIILTKKTVDNKTYNTLYKVTNFDSEHLQLDVITLGYLEIKNNVSIETNYESQRVSNIYICDGLTPIKVINMYDDSIDPTQVVYDPTRFDITPGATLLPFTLVNTISGALPAGSIQYCYLLFNLNGSETTTSSLSEIIPLTKYDKVGSSAKVKGQIKGELTDRGCQLRVKFKNDGRFDRARIFSIIYLDNTSVPDIYIINEIEIPDVVENGFTEFVYNDNGASFLSKITIDEFNAMVPFEFNAKCLEKMGNRLYAANIRELTWDIDKNYDTRAYRCDSSKSVRLNSSNTSLIITGTLSVNGLNTDVPKEHDCINPYNLAVCDDSATKYIYGVNEQGLLFEGGTGKNISYRFIYAELVLSDTTTTGVANDLEMSTSSSNNLFIYTYYEDGSSGPTYDLSTVPGRSIIPNYSDPYVCANFLGYQRDEIYRFGIIFYNNKNIPSPVHWIGDIRMPSHKGVSNTDSLVYPFHTGKYSKSFNRNVEQVAYALGIQFEIKNMPSDAVAWEIVRCDRTESDRTVVSQGVISSLLNFGETVGTGLTDGLDYSGVSFGENDIRPMPLFNLCSEYYVKFWNWESKYFENLDLPVIQKYPRTNGYIEFVSPEVCTAKQSILNSIQNAHVSCLYKVATYNDQFEQLEDYDGNEIKQLGYKLSKIDVIHSVEQLENDKWFGGVTMIGESRGQMYFHGGSGPNFLKGDARKWYEKQVLFKYYNVASSNESTYYTIDDAIIGAIIPQRIDLASAKNHAQGVGNKMYINTSIGGHKQFGGHGTNCVLLINGDFNITTGNNGNLNSKFNYLNTTYVTNIKRNTIPYGGNTYISRQNSIYVTCGLGKVAGEHTYECFGGDTYLSIFDYLNTAYTQIGDDAHATKSLSITTMCYIPLESIINTNLFSSDSYHTNATVTNGKNLIQNEPIVLGNGYTQEKPLYEYNPAYSSTSGAKQYVPKNIYAVDDLLSQCRIVVSEAKSNNEVTNSWTKFKFANYLDVDSQYGQITNLKTFNNKLFYWLDNAVGIASVNDRSLITDNNMAELTLGTGGILSRFDYVATLHGSSIVNDKSISNSPISLYWYDFDKNEICALNSNGVMSLSKLKGTLSYLNSLPKKSKTNAVSFYDSKYNEVWFKIYDEALIYNEQLSQFTCVYTHNANWFFPFSDKLITIKSDNTFYRHNVYEVVGDEILDTRMSKIQFVVNKDISNTKTFDNVVFSADLLDNSDIPYNIVDVLFSTKTQHTNLEGYGESPLPAYKSIEVREDNYRFAIPREKALHNATTTSTNQSYLGRMRGKYLICDYTFDCNNNREFKLPYVKTTYRYSML